MTAKFPTRTVNESKSPLIWAWLVLFVCLFQSSAVAQNGRARFHDTYRLDTLGNAKITRVLHLDSATYARLKQVYADPVKLMQLVSSQCDWHDYRVTDSRFDAKNKSVVVELEQNGLARTVAKGTWEIKSRAKSGAVELITCKDDRVILHGVMTADFGLVSTTVRVEFPENSKMVVFDEENPAFRYDFEPDLGNKDQKTEFIDEANWQVETASTLMACLSKVYGDESYDDLWTARSVFENSTGQTIRNFRIRFRVEGFGYWGPWNRAPIVYPNQKLVHGFFPVLDVEAMAKLENKTKARVIAELEYLEPDGQKIKQVKTHSIEVWPKNIVSLQPQKKKRGRQLGSRLVPMIVASFNSYNDPAIQQLAGRISGMANGPSSSLDSKDGVTFLRATFQFMKDNHFGYHPNGSPLGANGHELKISYPRNSLQRKSVNELDLAIFWASVANAVGMKSKIVVSDEHACTIVYLANGRGIPLGGKDFSNSTLEDVVKAGQDVLDKTSQGARIIVDTRQMEDMGIRPLELGPFESRYFDQKGFKFQKLPEPKRQTAQTR